MTVFLLTGMYTMQPTISIMIETFVRILMIILIGVVFLYYTYMGAKVYIYIRQRKSRSLIDDKEYIVCLSKKITFTLCYAIVMFAIGVLYVTSISLSIIAVI